MTLRIRVFFLSLAILLSPYVKADWVNRSGAESAPNIAEIIIFKDRIKVRLEVYVGNLKEFEELVPDSMLMNLGQDRPSLTQRMHTFAHERLQFITGEGQTLPAILELVEPRMRVDRRSTYGTKVNPITGRRAKEPPADKRVLYTEITYPFPETDRLKKPDQIQMIPPLEADGTVAANIGFVVFQEATPVIDYRYLSQAETLNLDWLDPWYSKFENQNLSRHHKYPLMLYMYVEPRRVRLESLMRFSDIANMTGFENTRSDLDAKHKNRLLLDHVKTYFSHSTDLQIDTEARQPDSVRVDLLRITLSGLKSIDSSSDVAESSLLVGVSQQFLIPHLPQKVETRWQYFNPRIGYIPTLVTDPVSPLADFVNESAPELGWKNFLKNYKEPVIRPVAVETGWWIDIPTLGSTHIFGSMPDQIQALNIVERVVENLRVAFLEKAPGRFSEVLEQVLVTSENKTLEKELGKLFSPAVSNGGVGSIEEIDELRMDTLQELESPDGFSASISGSARIVAQHWGHVDRRQIEFQARLDMVEHNAQWRLADLTVIDVKPAK